ncbi:MAG: nucleotidyltransferase family protein [Myxococcales bacterium]|nr:nucleotidyltransferase family protein [Myxococcales bacterium]
MAALGAAMSAADGLVPPEVPRARLLFAALRADPEVARWDRERWRGACEMALRTFSAPLLHAVLGRAGLLDQAPDEVVVRLARSRTWSAARWELLAEQSRALGEGMDAAGVRAVVIKGAHTGWLYADGGARGTADIDLLVAPGAVDAASRALIALGYEATAWEAHEDHRHLPPFLRAGGLPVELHRTLARRDEPATFVEGVDERLEPHPRAPGLLVMERTDALLYTIKHLAAHHRFETTNGIAGLADIGVLLEDIEPTVLLGRASEWGIARATTLSLALARDLLGAVVPDELLGSDPEGLREAEAAATATLLRGGWSATTRPLQLPASATLVPGLPVSGLAGPHPLRGLRRFVEHAALPLLDDLRTEFPRLGRTPAARLGYPLHWGRMAWRHAGLARLASPEVRRRLREGLERDRRTLAPWVGASG